MRLALLLGLAMTNASAAADEHEYLKAFPAATEGMTRFVLALPHKERGEDEAFLVELIVGKTIETDGVNNYFIGGSVEDRPLEGWGFTYYEVKELGPIGSTRKAAPPGTAPVTRFVAGPRKLLPYNSRVPIVIYVPSGAEVQYRIFEAGKTKDMKAG